MQKNLPLRLGLALCLFFVAIAIFGPNLAPYDPTLRFTDVIEVNDEIYIPSVRPVAPFVLGQFPLGTDHVGRDLLSRLMWAIRPTLIACIGAVLMRLLIGLPFGIFLGWSRTKWATRLLNGVMGTLIAIPPLILALALIALSAERPLSYFIIILGLIGWTDIATFYQTQTALLRQQGFVESSFALGSSHFAVIWRHILPQFWSTIPTLLAFELSAVLLIMAELGFLGIFIGNGLVVFGADPNSPAQIAIGLTSDVPELGQMLSDFTRKMFQAPWEMVAAAIVVFLQVFAFNLLGEGLRRRLDVTRR